MKLPTRGYIGGLLFGSALVEVINLMYQNNTIRHFYRGMMHVLLKDLSRRGIMINHKNIRRREHCGCGAFNYVCGECKKGLCSRAYPPSWYEGGPPLSPRSMMACPSCAIQYKPIYNYKGECNG